MSQQTVKADTVTNIIKRLSDELVATEDLVNEGDPFYMTRKDYYDNLLWIVTGKSPTYETPPSYAHIEDKNE